MPEMLQYCGQRFRVYKRADKACDTVRKTGSRRMMHAVHLEGARCDGSAHGGCQAACLLFWKEVWLKPAAADPIGGRDTAIPESRTTLPVVSALTGHCSEDGLSAATRRASAVGEEDVYVCQATELPSATTPLAWWDVRQYVRDVTSGNVGVRPLVQTSVISGFNIAMRLSRRLAMAFSAQLKRSAAVGVVAVPSTISAEVPRVPSHGRSFIQHLSATADKMLSEYPKLRGQLRKTPSGSLNLQAGELVQVKSKAEIEQTLDVNNKNRGLLFDVEMLLYCGGTFRVLNRIERIIDERTGRMRRLPNDCIVLDGVVCKGCLSRDRRMCPRSIYSYWREVWLRRVE